MVRITRTLAFIAIAASAFHCTSSPPPSSVPAGVDAGPTQPPIASGVVTPSSGGVVATPDGTVRVEVPPGAISKETTFTITPATSYPDDPQVVPGTVFNFGPDGIVFSAPVVITIG